MELTITVSAKGIYSSAGYGITIAEPFVQAFEPIKTTDEPMLAFAFGEAMPDSAVVVRKLKQRDDAVKLLADGIAKALLAEMSKHDTHNGY